MSRVAPAKKQKNPLRILFASAEALPLIKTGGLADVSAALPTALHEIGVDVRLLLPAYRGARELAKQVDVVAQLTLPALGKATLLLARFADLPVPVYLVERPDFFDRPGNPYLDETGQDWADNAQRFGLLSSVAALLATDASPLSWRPDVLHCNDWQTGLAPAYMHFHAGKRAASLMTIHNLAFQGIFPAGMLTDVGLPAESFSISGVEYFGKLSFLKAGLYYADALSTVSPTYAREIQREPLGFGLHGLLKSRARHLVGILNGIDVAQWNPAQDSMIAQHYDVESLAAKAGNKAALQKWAGFEIAADIPLIGMVGRITEQKGIDWVLAVLPALLDSNVQFVILGSGEADFEQQVVALEARFPRQLRAFIGFDERLSHRVEAGADMFLMPSRFEPCGLNQMYSMRYGTPPIVHATGGLVDTVIDANPKTLANVTATGFTFKTASASALLKALNRALTAYGNPDTWRKIQRCGMRRDFSWTASARAYLDVYSGIVKSDKLTASDLSRTR